MTTRSDFDNTNRGVLFKDTEKGEGDRKPDYTGKINVQGKDWRLAGWIKESKSGTKFLSLAVSEFKVQPKSDL